MLSQYSGVELINEKIQEMVIQNVFKVRTTSSADTLLQRKNEVMFIRHKSKKNNKDKHGENKQEKIKKNIKMIGNVFIVIRKVTLLIVALRKRKLIRKRK